MADRPSLFDEDAARHLRQLLAQRRRVDTRRTGRHGATISGRGLDYRDHRRYVAGDDPRFIDWRVYARTERYFVREYDAEAAENIILVLDESASMNAFRPDQRSKRDVVRQLAVTLAYVHLSQQDRVAAFRVTDEADLLMAPQSHPEWIGSMISSLSKPVFRKQTDLASMVSTAASLMRGERKTIILWTDLVSPAPQLLRFYKELSRVGAQLVIWHVVDPLEDALNLRGEWVVTDPESEQDMLVDLGAIRRVYAEKWQHFVSAQRQQMGKLGIRYVRSSLDESAIDVLARFLIQDREARL